MYISLLQSLFATVVDTNGRQQRSNIKGKAGGGRWRQESECARVGEQIICSHNAHIVMPTQWAHNSACGMQLWTNNYSCTITLMITFGANQMFASAFTAHNTRSLPLCAYICVFI